MGPDVSVSVPVGGLDAKLNMASKTPAEQRRNAARVRGLKSPDSDVDFFCIVFVVTDNAGGRKRPRKVRNKCGAHERFGNSGPNWMLIFRDPKFGITEM